MIEQIMSTNALQTFITNTFRSKKVLVREHNNIITIEPVGEKSSYSTELRGLLADYPKMSVENFLDRKHTDKGLDF
jgi:hypothetical protein